MPSVLYPLSVPLMYDQLVLFSAMPYSMAAMMTSGSMISKYSITSAVMVNVGMGLILSM